MQIADVAQPNNNARRCIVPGTHLYDLVVPLGNVVLVDADCEFSCIPRAPKCGKSSTSEARSTCQARIGRSKEDA